MKEGSCVNIQRHCLLSPNFEQALNRKKWVGQNLSAGVNLVWGNACSLGEK